MRTADLAAVLDAPDPAPVRRSRPLTFEEFVERVGADDRSGSWGRLFEGECPVHGARRALHLVPFEDGTAEAYCTAGCSPEAILDALAIEPGPDYFRGAIPGRFVLAHSLPGVGTSSNRFAARAVSRGALARMPAPEPLIEDTLDRQTVALLAGPSGIGKSFVALGWAASIATGLPWMGRKARRGRVLYLAGEGSFGLHARLSAWESYTGTEIPDEGLVILPEAVQIGDEETRAEFLAYVEEERFDLVIVDTLARAAVGLDENSARDMGVFVSAVDEIKRASGGTVLLVHHTGKDRTTVRGSSALEGAVDTAYAVLGDRGADLFDLRRTKRKDGPVFDEHSLRLDSVEESCVVVVAETGIRSSAEDERPALVAAYRTIVTHHGDFAETKTVLRDTLRESLGVGRTRAYELIKRLAEEDLLRNIGTDKTPKLRIDTRRAAVLGFPRVEPFALEAPPSAPDVAEIL